ncbi:MAG: glycine zipper domain-containing protein [Planctomycetota bacterium]
MTNPASRRSLLAVSCVIAAGLAVGGCNNAAEGAFSGAALGAGSGAAIGSFSGNAGQGAAIGAIAGALGGAIIGDQNERNARYHQRGGYYGPQHPSNAYYQQPPYSHQPDPYQQPYGGYTQY